MYHSHAIMSRLLVRPLLFALYTLFCLGDNTVNPVLVYLPGRYDATCRLQLAALLDPA
jgi:hypothetical protein